MDANNTIYLRQSSLTADHNLTIGKDISYSETHKRTENLANVVYVLGGGTPNLFNKYTRNSSVSTYGKFEYKLQDGTVTDNTTSDIMAKNYLDRNQSPETRTELYIVDNNGENANLGQNIEAFNIGDTIQIKNLNYGSKGVTLWNVAIWDVDVWDSTIQFSTASILTIQSINYYPEYIDIQASNRLPDINRVIQSLQTQQNMMLQENIPTVPTVRTV
jgi:predicted nucleic acid-binding OB-fold protein